MGIDLFSIAGVELPGRPEPPAEPMVEVRALSIRQPWAWLIIHAGKDIENRIHNTRHRGPLYIHAPKTVDPYDHVRDTTDPLEIKLPPPAELRGTSRGFRLTIMDSLS